SRGARVSFTRPLNLSGLSTGRYPVRSYVSRSVQHPAMIRVSLSDQDARRLEDEYRRAQQPTSRQPLHNIPLAPPRRPPPQVPPTVQRWLNRYLEHGLAGLRSRKAKGAEAKIPPEMAGEIRRWVIDGPQAQGLDRANWTHAELAEHLSRTHGIRASRSAMQRF